VDGVLPGLCPPRGLSRRRLSSYPLPHEARRPPRAWLHATSSAVTEPRPLRTGGSGWRPTQAKNRRLLSPAACRREIQVGNLRPRAGLMLFLAAPAITPFQAGKPENSRRQAAGLLSFVSCGFGGRQRESPDPKGRASHNAHVGSLTT